MSIEAITAVLEHSQLRGTAKLVLISLAWHANADGLAWPSQKTIARQSGGISLRQVRNCTSQAVAAGDILEAGVARRNVLVWRLAILDRQQSHPGTQVPGSDIDPGNPVPRSDTDPGNPVPGSASTTPELQFRVQPRPRKSSAPTPETQFRQTLKNLH